LVTYQSKKLNHRCRGVSRWWELWWGKVVSLEVTLKESSDGETLIAVLYITW